MTRMRPLPSPRVPRNTKYQPRTPPPANILEYYRVIQRCNKFPGNFEDLWEVRVLDNGYPIGYLYDDLKQCILWDNTVFQVNEGIRSIHLKPELAEGEDAVARCNEEFLRLAEQNLLVLNKSPEAWARTKNNCHPIGGLNYHLRGMKVPDPLRGVIGQVTRGVHLNVFTYRLSDEGRYELCVWVSKRASRATYAGMFDQIVAGGMDAEDHMDPMATLIREAREEAGMTIDVTTRDVTDSNGFVGTVRAGPTITFYDEKGTEAGAEYGQLEPGIRKTYDLQVSPSYVPVPAEPEAIEGFVLKPVEEVRQSLLNAEWKPNSGLVTLDLLLRLYALESGQRGCGTLQKNLNRVIPAELMGYPR